MCVEECFLTGVTQPNMHNIGLIYITNYNLIYLLTILITSYAAEVKSHCLHLCVMTPCGLAVDYHYFEATFHFDVLTEDCLMTYLKQYIK
jgi:hypothetical protein